MRRVVLMSALIFAGCGSDPAQGRLEPASQAILYAPDKAKVEVVFEEPMAGTTYYVPRSLPAGLPVIVASDAEKDLGEHGRRVTVNIREGEYQSKSGSVDRRNLRPCDP